MLSVSVYFAVIPPFERRGIRSTTIEISLIAEIFSVDRPLLRLPKIAAYDYREGRRNRRSYLPISSRG